MFGDEYPEPSLVFKHVNHASVWSVFYISKSALISSTLQTVVLGLNFIGCGNLPSLTPAHHVDLETGIGPIGANICFTRTRALSR